MCECVCVETSVHAHMCVLAGHGGESLVFQAEDPEAEKFSTGLKTREESSLPGVCWRLWRCVSEQASFSTSSPPSPSSILLNNVPSQPCN